MADDKREASRSARLFSYFRSGESDGGLTSDQITENERLDIAVHEASHAIIAYQLNVKFIKTSIKHLDECGTGKTIYGKDHQYESGTKSAEEELKDREMWAKIALAGFIGEKKVSVHVVAVRETCQPVSSRV